MECLFKFHKVYSCLPIRMIVMVLRYRFIAQKYLLYRKVLYIELVRKHILRLGIQIIAMLQSVY